jgi:hypothetical protein
MKGLVAESVDEAFKSFNVSQDFKKAVILKSQIQ